MLQSPARELLEHTVYEVMRTVGNRTLLAGLLWDFVCAIHDVTGHLVDYVVIEPNAGADVEELIAEIKRQMHDQIKIFDVRETVDGYIEFGVLACQGRWARNWLNHLKWGHGEDAFAGRLVEDG